jgi:hypothetical protein
MRIIIHAAMDMPLLPAECAKYSELSGVQLEVLLQQIEQDVRCRLKEVSAHPVHPGTTIDVDAELVDAYALRASLTPYSRDHAYAMMLHAGELTVPLEPTRRKLTLPGIPKGPPPSHGHFLCNGQYFWPDGKITGDPMPGFMDYRPLDSVERVEPKPETLTPIAEKLKQQITEPFPVLDRDPAYVPLQPCGCLPGMHSEYCRHFNRYRPGYCSHGGHPALHCVKCFGPQGG